MHESKSNTPLASPQAVKYKTTLNDAELKSSQIKQVSLPFAKELNKIVKHREKKFNKSFSYNY